MCKDVVFLEVIAYLTGVLASEVHHEDVLHVFGLAFFDHDVPVLVELVPEKLIGVYKEFAVSYPFLAGEFVF